MIRQSRAALAACLLMGFMLAGCAAPPNGGRDELGVVEPWDPLENVNRVTFDANMWLNDNAIGPTAQAYRWAVPDYVQLRLRHGIANLGEPLVFGNDMAQARVKSAFTTFWRFVFNSTVGLAGLYDVATDLGLPRQTGDFGQTLYAWGMRESPYLVLPLFGPSTVRDGMGMGVEMWADPTGRVLNNANAGDANIAIGVVGGLDKARNLETLNELKKGTIDFYALLRSVWLQNRQATLDEAVGITSSNMPAIP
ncbi:MlaA family lipoprotein [Nitrospirillum iridis]|uniref:Phospholipid-binding lipoprotein MlaA n=1 Tax=Nitrospirillum iridis TaxID=765888 RepID=A0A7X0B1P7_9PROT|nr:VacJ family lipoprotein [Nitrospirillum iridis]MBB6252756.1 phospholipid-binding lipoprotein MlaA [Nitrospirillum iridis]